MRLRPSCVLIVALAALAVAGCTTLPAGDRAADTPASGASAPKVQTRANEARRGKSGEALAPESLIGSDEAGIIRLVGAPGLVRREKGVDVWQYTDDTCTLLFFFYDREGGRQLTYLEAMPKAPGGEAVTRASCLSDQIRAFHEKELS